MAAHVYRREYLPRGMARTILDCLSVAQAWEPEVSRTDPATGIVRLLGGRVVVKVGKGCGFYVAEAYGRKSYARMIAELIERLQHRMVKAIAVAGKKAREEAEAHQFESRMARLIAMRVFLLGWMEIERLELLAECAKLPAPELRH